MPIDKELFAKPAIRGDVTGVAINASLAFSAIARCLEIVATTMNADSGQSLPAKEDIQREIAGIKEAAEKLEQAFDRLSGWTPDT